jgi:carbon monoxide dehydrogenase subunit G
MAPAGAYFDLEAEGEGTRVTWTVEMDMGNNPVGRWMGLMMDGMVGKDFDAGLANLKAKAEGK